MRILLTLIDFHLQKHYEMSMNNTLLPFKAVPSFMESYSFVSFLKSQLESYFLIVKKVSRY